MFRSDGLGVALITHYSGCEASAWVRWCSADMFFFRFGGACSKCCGDVEIDAGIGRAFGEPSVRYFAVPSINR